MSLPLPNKASMFMISQKMRRIVDLDPILHDVERELSNLTAMLEEHGMPHEMAARYTNKIKTIKQERDK